jgi:glutamate racemase
MSQAPSFPLAPHEAEAHLIGVFDSGVGGLSIARAVRRRMPHSPLLYVGDVAHSPYGERPTGEVVERAKRITAWLVERGARTIVVACNTATVLAIESLRSQWPAVVFVGVEPGIKPAAALTRTGRIAVMTTPATARSDRLHALIDRHASSLFVHVRACAGLAGAIERGDLAGEALRRVLEPQIEAVRTARVDTVVLGCTHYAFVDLGLREVLGNDVMLVETSAAVAERIASLATVASKPALSASAATATARIFSTGATRTMHRLAATFLDGSKLGIELLDL